MTPRKPRARFLWITDPWDTLDHPRDTTLRLAEESEKLGFENFWCDFRSIRLESGKVLVEASRFLEFGPGRTKDSIRLESAKDTLITEFTSLQYRTDPPVDLCYLQPLQILGLGLLQAGRKAPELVNPLGILTAGNEKIEAGALANLLPETLASSSREVLDRFGRKLGRAVLKPLHQAQSKGVELLNWQGTEGAALALKNLETATEGFCRPTLLQEFLPGIKKGETRLWFLDGKLLAHVKKLPLASDFRVNMDRGSHLAHSALTAGEKKSARQIGAYLKKRGIRLAAVDLIEGKITDFNFTSPGLIVPMEELLGKNLARPIVKALLRRSKA